ncbi:MAG: PqqD family protein [Myxococcota bacterium]|nr:PqqD family protein [Myxococcota bacterium]
MTSKLIERELGSELLIYEAEQDTVFVLNPTSRLIFQLYREKRTPKEIEREIRKRFHVKRDEKVLFAVKDCLEQLRDKGLIEGDE